MKTDDEMYQSVLSRYNDYQQKKKHRIIITRRIVSLAACFVAIFSGYQIWNKISATPPQIPIIEETTETTFNPVTTTKTDTTVTTEKTTETTADTTTATITSDNLTANITQTTAVSSAVQCTAVNTDETVTTAVHTENTTALQTTVSASITTQTMVTTSENELLGGAGSEIFFEIVYNGVTYRKNNGISDELIGEKIRVYDNLELYKIKDCSEEIIIAQKNRNGYFTAFSNPNYPVEDLNKVVNDTGFNSLEEYGITYESFMLTGDKAVKGIKEILLSDLENAEYVKYPINLDETEFAFINTKTMFKMYVYVNGYLGFEFVNGIIFYKTDEEKANSFFEYLNQIS